MRRYSVRSSTSRSIGSDHHRSENNYAEIKIIRTLEHDDNDAKNSNYQRNIIYR